MKKKLFISFLTFLIAVVSMAENALDSVLTQLDKAIQDHGLYTDTKDIRIEKLKKRLYEVKNISRDQYHLNYELYEEYRSYVCDSAIFYLNRCIEIANRLGDTHNEYENIIILSDLMGATGMYKEGVDMLQTIPRAKLPATLLVDYYNASYHIYGELAFYTQNKNYSHIYRAVSDQYRDSLNAMLPEDTELHLVLRETYFRDTRNLKEALRINDIRLAKVEPGTPEYAMVTYHRSLIYQAAEETDMQKYYLALSALSDIRSANKDHASLWMLAEILYAEGDIGRAYDYIRFSWNETVFYNARLRSLQSAVILSLIDKTYQAMIVKQNDKLEKSLIIISALLPMLFIAMLFIYRQVKRLSIARKNLQAANNQLKILNEDLQQMNIRLQSTNLDLTESNQIKEEYIGRFIKLCSTYIDKLDVYRRMVHKRLLNGQTAELLKMTRSQEALDDELRELYHNFDAAFLQLFPDFVSKVNGILQEEDRIVLKKGELLNTELRILALIRLGIEDSSQIAEFLRYSVNTIYNYRAKVKNRARGARDDFEKQIRMIR